MKASTEFKSIPIEFLKRGQYQPRKLFNEEALQELAESILAQGLIEPLIIRRHTENSYEIIAGERRWRAAMIAGLSEVPCLISNYNDQQAAAITLIENIQRENLSLLEEAAGYQRLLSEFHFSQNEVATLIGKSRSHIANLLRLLTLCPAIQEHLHQGKLSLGHARMLVGLSPLLQESLARLVITQQWSVRKLENEARKARTTLQKTGLDVNNPDISHLEIRLAEQIGAPVEVIHDAVEGGWLKIKFYDNDTLAGLLDRMGLRYD